MIFGKILGIIIIWGLIYYVTYCTIWLGRLFEEKKINKKTILIISGILTGLFFIWIANA